MSKVSLSAVSRSLVHLIHGDRFGAMGVDIETLATHAALDGGAFPALREVADACGFSPKTGKPVPVTAGTPRAILQALMGAIEKEAKGCKPRNMPKDSPEAAVAREEAARAWGEGWSLLFTSQLEDAKAAKAAAKAAKDKAAAKEAAKAAKAAPAAPAADSTEQAAPAADGETLETLRAKLAEVTRERDAAREECSALKALLGTMAPAAEQAAPAAPAAEQAPVTFDEVTKGMGTVTFADIVTGASAAETAAVALLTPKGPARRVKQAA